MMRPERDVLIAKSREETMKIASGVAKNILKKKSAEKAVVIGLIGDLGSGKTVFAKGFARALGIKENIVSPTFVLERIYKLKVKSYKFFIHIDAYRLKKSREILDLGFGNLIREPENIILIEWADRIKRALPRNCVKIKFEHMTGNRRKITIK